MRARQIQESLDSISNFPYPKVWVEYYREKQIQDEAWQGVFDEIVAKGYSHISIFSDDAVMEVEAATEVVEMSKKLDVVCGWCNIDSGPLTNISKSPLVHDHPKAYRVKELMYSIHEVENHKNDLIKTWFTGFSLHTMRVELWEKFPFMSYPGSAGNGYASDYHLCWRLQQNSIPIVALKAGRVYHIRKNIEKQDFKVLAGVRDKNIRWEE
jgi:GT2 family glycosyltransferase